MQPYNKMGAERGRKFAGRRTNALSAIVLAALVICAVGAFALGGCSSGAESVAGTSPSDEIGNPPALLDVSDASSNDASPALESSGAVLPDVAVDHAATAKMAELIAQIQETVDAAGMDVNVAVIDLKSGAKGGCGSTNPMVAASMIKLIIAETFLQEVASGEYFIDEYYTLQYSDIVGGSGSLGGYGAGAQVTYREILEKMIAESDNTAANILIEAIGMDSVNVEATRLGLYGTQLNRYMMDADAIASGSENYVSADDVATLLKMIYDGTFVDVESSALVLQMLEQQEDSGGILDGLPEDVTFAHKTGALDNVRHDGGIVEGDHPFVLVVLCGGDGYSETGALDVMAQIGKAAYGGIAGKK